VVGKFPLAPALKVMEAVEVLHLAGERFYIRVENQGKFGIGRVANGEVGVLAFLALVADVLAEKVYGLVDGYPNHPCCADLAACAELPEGYSGLLQDVCTVGPV